MFTFQVVNWRSMYLLWKKLSIIFKCWGIILSLLWVFYYHWLACTLINVWMLHSKLVSEPECKALVSATHLSCAQSARSISLSASAAHNLTCERWARVHLKITECLRKLARIFALKLKLFWSILRNKCTCKPQKSKVYVTFEKLIKNYGNFVSKSLSAGEKSFSLSRLTMIQNF